jgi:hypothetical protein
VALDEFLELLVGRRRLERFFDLATGVCTLTDVDDGRKYHIDIASLQRCCLSEISRDPLTAM